MVVCFMPQNLGEDPPSTVGKVPVDDALPVLPSRMGWMSLECHSIVVALGHCTTARCR